MKRFTKRTSAILFFILLATYVNGQNMSFKDIRAAQKAAIGADFPDLQFESIINGPKQTLVTKNSLKGKVVILEFWATWCAPCIKQFPKINALAENYKNDVVFISITRESEEIVRPFLKRKAMDTWVAMDTDGSVIDYFGVYAYPSTIAIDKTGKVIELLNPKQLNEAYLDALIAGKSVQMEEKPKPEVISLSASKPSEKKLEKSPTFQVSVHEVDADTPEGGSWGKTLGFVSVTGWTLRKALAFASNKSESLIFGPDSLLNKKLSINIQLPRQQPELLGDLLKQALTKELKLETAVETQQVELYEMIAPKGASKDLFPTRITSKGGHMSNDDGIVGASNQSIEKLIPYIEGALQRKVIDKTSLSEKYDYNLYWEHDNPRSIITAPEDQLGLVLNSVKQEMAVLVIKPAKEKKGSSPFIIRGE